MIDLYYEPDNFNAQQYIGSVLEKEFREWCRENCSEYFIMDILGRSFRFSFSNEADAMGFKLRWL